MTLYMLDGSMASGVWLTYSFFGGTKSNPDPLKQFGGELIDENVFSLSHHRFITWLGSFNIYLRAWKERKQRTGTTELPETSRGRCRADRHIYTSSPQIFQAFPISPTSQQIFNHREVTLYQDFIIFTKYLTIHFLVLWIGIIKTAVVQINYVCFVMHYSSYIYCLFTSTTC